VSDRQPPNAGSDDAGIADRAIQQQWDRYAMNDFSGEPEAYGSPQAPISVELTNSPIATRAFDGAAQSSSGHEDSKWRC
jgi:hypothetical protein